MGFVLANGINVEPCMMITFHNLLPQTIQKVITMSIQTQTPSDASVRHRAGSYGHSIMYESYSITVKEVIHRHTHTRFEKSRTQYCQATFVKILNKLRGSLGWF